METPPPDKEDSERDEHKVKGSVRSLKKQSLRSSIFGTLHEYADNATTHGISYACDTSLPKLQRLLWSIVCIVFSVIAVLLIDQSYKTWVDYPIITSVQTTGKDISTLDFPAITICGQGWIADVLTSSLLEQYRGFAKNDPKYKATQSPVIQRRKRSVSTLNFGDDLEMEKKWMTAYYPGAFMDPQKFIPALASPDVGKMENSKVLTDGGYDECNSIAKWNLVDRKVETECGNGWEVIQPDGSSTKICIWKLFPETTFEDDPCPALGAQRLFFETDGKYFDDKIKTFRDANVPMTGQQRVWINAYYHNLYPSNIKVADFFGNGIFLDRTSWNAAPIDNSDPNNFCGTYGQSTDNFLFDSIEVNLCSAPGARELKALNVCMKEFKDCSAGGGAGGGGGSGRKKRLATGDQPKYKPTALDYAFHPVWKHHGKELLKKLRSDSKKNFAKMNMTASFKHLFEILWNTQLPCYDVKGATSTKDQQNGMLKSCYWKGVKMPCSTIFKTMPTDRGMCCSFNLMEAEKLFRKGPFVESVKRMQERDLMEAFDKKEVALEDKFPLPQAGKAKGLTVVLDAHSDLLTSSSVYDDVEGFYAVVGSKNQYPMTNHKSIFIRPGFTNQIGIDPVHIAADKSIKHEYHATPQKRFCLFKDEMTLKFHNFYSEGNCVLECTIDYVLNKMNLTSPCVPWYFPARPKETRMCTPYEASDFVNHLKESGDNKCEHCLPDCVSTKFSTTVSASPFRRCDNKNLGLTGLCTFKKNGESLDPPMWGKNVIREETEGKDRYELPEHIKKAVTTNERNLYSKTEKKQVFANANKGKNNYDAYEKDVAIANFYFQSSTCFEFVRQPRMTIIDFISSVGGLLGLCMGISFVSAVELVYWLTVKLAKNIQ